MLPLRYLFLIVLAVSTATEGRQTNPITVGICSGLSQTWAIASSHPSRSPRVSASSCSWRTLGGGVERIFYHAGNERVTAGMKQEPTRLDEVQVITGRMAPTKGCWDRLGRRRRGSAVASSVEEGVELCTSHRSDNPWTDLAASRGRGSGIEDSTVQNPAGTASRGGATSLTYAPRPLVFWENMVCGAISRSIAQTIMHPANTMKTLLQSSRTAVGSGAEALSIVTLARRENLPLLARGAGAQFLMSVPHGAINFAVLEFVRRRMAQLVSSSRFADRFGGSGVLGPGLDFLSSAISTVCCSVVSTPQMMITDNIMAGTYPNMAKAVKGLASERGVMGFYTGWWPGLAGKIPSYALTWTFFQELKAAQKRIFQRDPTDIENSIMGCLASGTTVCIMIPMDTIKTRLVTQGRHPDLIPYKGITDAAVRIMKEEGIGAFYRGLTPRLVSVVPMIGIQFGVYEFMKKVMLERTSFPAETSKDEYSRVDEKATTQQTMEEVAMEVAADDDQPFPAPQFKAKYFWGKGKPRRKSRKKEKL